MADTPLHVNVDKKDIEYGFILDGVVYFVLRNMHCVQYSKKDDQYYPVTNSGPDYLFDNLEPRRGRILILDFHNVTDFGTVKDDITYPDDIAPVLDKALCVLSWISGPSSNQLEGLREFSEHFKMPLILSFKRGRKSSEKFKFFEKGSKAHLVGELSKRFGQLVLLDDGKDHCQSVISYGKINSLPINAVVCQKFDYGSMSYDERKTLVLDAVKKI